MRAKIPTESDAVQPARPATLNPDDYIGLSEVCSQTRMDKKTILAAIHAGKLPAFWPGGNHQVGFRMHRRDVEAWFFSDPERAHTPGVGTPEGPRARREGIDQYQAEDR